MRRGKERGGEKRVGGTGQSPSPQSLFLFFLRLAPFPFSPRLLPPFNAATQTTLISTSATLNEMIFLALTGLYKHSTVGAYFAGTGLAVVIANLYYLGECYASVSIHGTKPSK